MSAPAECKGVAQMALWGILRLLGGALDTPASDRRSAYLYILFIDCIRLTGGDPIVFALGAAVTGRGRIGAVSAQNQPILV